MNDIKRNLSEVLKDIRNTEIKSGRKEGSVKLVAVSKFHSAEEIVLAINSGQFLFGENRVQEASEKFPNIIKDFPKTKLHMIGRLQKNKVKKILEVATCIDSVDSLSLLLEIEKKCLQLEKSVSVMFELHTAEDTKSGFQDLDELCRALEMCRNGDFPHILPYGFMTMAPFSSDESLVRKSFVTARKISEEMRKNYPELPLNEISMGMSGDFKIAIEEGSTMVRIGTAIFGERKVS